ncbi:cyclase family protein [Ruania zhangjianzhongii]|uniref:cyclase family protein n=1 Tax=Ruania zhangjianzhongii TaxID=2603206 RepID=UPI0011C9A462|nr:cyclase family protein [Ruania zhangjianzhongii]
MPDYDARHLVDLSHTIRAGLVTYPGLPGPRISPHLSREASASHYAPGTTFSIDAITMVGNTGTYLDTAFHRYADGPDLAALELETLVDLPTEVFHLEEAATRGIVASALAERDVRGKAVLLHTGWDRHFGTPAYGEDAPFLTADGVRHLLEAGATAVGIDSVNLDDASPAAEGQRPAHSTFLGAGIHVLEHLTNLGALPASGARLTVVPPKIEGFGTFPVRAFATVPAVH